jgi:transposase-like protein
VTAVRHDRGFWERAAREIERGRSVAVVAGRLGVRPRTLAWWCWRLRREGASRNQARKAEFLPVVVAEPVVTPSYDGAVELGANGIQVRIGVGTDVRYVAALMHALRTTC